MSNQPSGPLPGIPATKVTPEVTYAMATADPPNSPAQEVTPPAGPSTSAPASKASAQQRVAEWVPDMRAPDFSLGPTQDTSPRCATFSDEVLTEWLLTSKLSADSILTLNHEDIYDSHTAVRHIPEVDLNGHCLKLIMKQELRTNPAFTPWLTEGTTLYRGLQKSIPRFKQDISLTSHQEKVCVLHFHSRGNHIKSPDCHLASYDARIAGLLIRTLFDSGATCSCISQRLVQRLNLPITSSTKNQQIGGVGGAIQILGQVNNADIKLGRYHTQHPLLVVNEPIAGYDCILGQDFLKANHVAMIFSPNQLCLQINAMTKNPITLFRTTTTDLVAKIPDRDAGHFALPLTLTLQARPTSSEQEERGNPESMKSFKRFLQEINKGKQIAYQILISKVEDNTDISQSEIPEGIQEVINKHSQPGSTLCGKIPNHTHAKDFQCKIELIDGAHAVHIRQYRLTPLEKSELIEQVKAFIEKGWIEPSTSNWSSSVLFVPKPNGKLRFCVDYRALNKVTRENRGPIPNSSELLDELQGAKYFSALDLASGYYQLEMAPDSRPYTAFPTPYGLYQWRVMPMGLCNAPAIFQTAMNLLLRDHIDRGYCKVYLDDIIILSKSIAEHQEHLDAVLTSLKEYNLYCQLPKCQWARQELRYLGHIVTGTEVKPDPKRAATLDKWEPPLSQVANFKNAKGLGKNSDTWGI